MKKPEVEKTKHSSPPSCRLNENKTTFKEKFPSWPAPGWAALLSPPALSPVGRAQVTLPCPGGMAAELTGSQGLEGCLNITPQLCFSRSVTRLKRNNGLQGDFSHFPTPQWLCDLTPPLTCRLPNQSHPSYPGELLQPSLCSFCRGQPSWTSTSYLCCCVSNTCLL